MDAEQTETTRTDSSPISPDDVRSMLVEFLHEFGNRDHVRSLANQPPMMNLRTRSRRGTVVTSVNMGLQWSSEGSSNRLSQALRADMLGNRGPICAAIVDRLRLLGIVNLELDYWDERPPHGDGTMRLHRELIFVHGSPDVRTVRQFWKTLLQ